MLNNTLDDLIELQDAAIKDILNTKTRFFLSRESKQWFEEIDGKLLSSIETTDSNDLLVDSLFKNLIAPHISAADFGKSLSSVVSNGQLLDPVFLNLSTVSSMYEPLVELGGDTSYVMEPDRRMLDAELECACKWEEIEKYSD